LAISAIIAAYNEEETIADVLAALSRNPLITEIILVSDGSTDRTVEIARSFPDVMTIALRENQGKGCAMRLGVDHAAHDVLFFVDGDMLNVNDEHIESLVGPVLRNECDMNVGVRHRGTVRDFLHLKVSVGPVLSGIRVMRRKVFECVPPQYMQRFKIELALNYFCNLAGYSQSNTVIYGLGHVIKEKKRGMLSGLTSRLAMTREVFLLHFDLYVFQTWRWSSSNDASVTAGEYDLFEAELLD
jgi:glycosyltransferase involved in cell wall biosynthesis